MTVDSKEFLETHLHGKRFDGGNIPALVLRDLTSLQEVVIEVCKIMLSARTPRQETCAERLYA